MGGMTSVSRRADIRHARVSRADAASSRAAASQDEDARDESGRRVVSGVYFVRFENAVHSETRKITVLK